MESSLTRVWITALIATVGFGRSNSICSNSFLPSTFELELFLPESGLIPHPLDLLVASYRFSCEGNITHWEAFTSGNGVHPIEFQVWRDQPELLRYELIGINTFSEATPSDGKLRLRVPEGEQIHVQPGDFVGISTREGSEPNPFQIRRIIGHYVRYNMTERGYNDVPQELRLRTLSPAAGFETCFSTAVTPRNFSATPLINAIVESTSASTPAGSSSLTSTTPTDPTSTNVPGSSLAVTATSTTSTDPTSTSVPTTPPSELTLVIATAVLAALLLTTLIVLTLTVTVFCCYLRQKKREYVTNPKQEPSPGTTQEQLTTNPAYNSVTGEEMAMNQAYSNGTRDAHRGTMPRPLNGGTELRPVFSADGGMTRAEMEEYINMNEGDVRDSTGGTEPYYSRIIS